MNDDITYNYVFPKNCRVKHRQLEIVGTVIVSALMSNEVMVRWDNCQTEKINIGEIELLQKISGLTYD